MATRSTRGSTRKPASKAPAKAARRKPTQAARAAPAPRSAPKAAPKPRRHATAKPVRRIVAKGPAAPAPASLPLASSSDVDGYLAKVDHPLKPVLEAVRHAILATDTRIGEGIKWNAPSFRHKDYFATAGLRSPEYVLLIFHCGAKVGNHVVRGRIDDPQGLLQWLARDRCAAKFHDLPEVSAKKAALQSIVSQWIAQM